MMMMMRKTMIVTMSLERGAGAASWIGRDCFTAALAKVAQEAAASFTLVVITNIYIIIIVVTVAVVIIVIIIIIKKTSSVHSYIIIKIIVGI